MLPSRASFAKATSFLSFQSARKSPRETKHAAYTFRLYQPDGAPVKGCFDRDRASEDDGSVSRCLFKTSFHSRRVNRFALLLCWGRRNKRAFSDSPAPLWPILAESLSSVIAK